MVTSLKEFIEFQSSLAWLASPPDDYELEAVDLLETLDDIASTVQSGGYDSEYDFQLAVFEAIISAHDGHLNYVPDIFVPFVFGNDLAEDLLSVSSDGVSVPKLYRKRHIDRWQNSGESGLPPAIEQINGQAAADYINEITLKYTQFQDPDAMWNSQFATYQTPQILSELGASLVYHGDSLTFTYEDGSEDEAESYAFLSNEASARLFANRVRSGEDFYDAFLQPIDSLPTVARRSEVKRLSAEDQKPRGVNSIANAKEIVRARIAEQRELENLPVALTNVTEGGGGTVAGYFLDGDGYDDTAVLAVSDFIGTDGDVYGYLEEFQATVEDFLNECRSEGKEKLVIDVTGNGGGLVAAGLELFAQLFPDEEQWGANNMRLGTAVQPIAEILGSISPFWQPEGLEENQAFEIITTNPVILNYMPSLGTETPEGEAFATVDDVLGPVTLNGDEFTAFQNSPLDAVDAAWNMTGTGDRSSPAPAPFSPENIVILTDGTCGSTCTIFSYLMIDFLGVRTTTVGGRPQTGSMQSIGGVEGSQLFLHLDISNAAYAALVLSGDERDDLENGPLGILSEAYSLRRSSDLTGMGVNGKNAFGPRNAEVPFQFLNAPANCRFFYTYEMTQDGEATWRYAVDATWTNPDEFCVEDSQNEVLGAVETFDSAFSEDGEGGGSGDSEGEDGEGGDGEGAATAVFVGRSAAVIVGLTLLLQLL